ncbi:MAG: UDP-N-acetylmuramate--L-alanine ligase [Mucinivorans sp.]
MKRVYFIGIGGIGMSALARFFAHQGYAVAGYDRTSTALTQALEQEGIPVCYTDSEEAIPVDFRQDKAMQVIYTPAIPQDSVVLRYVLANGFEIMKRSAALGLLCNDKYLMAVAGTHGKTTTSTLAAHLNAVGAGQGSAFLGGISKNFGSNLVLGSGSRVVVEADEFDRSFLQLTPRVALVTACDADHLDIYGTPEEFLHAFRQFLSQVSDCSIVKFGLPLPSKYTYSLDNRASDYYARNITLLEGGYYQYDIVMPDRVLERCRLGIPGLVNVENSVGAVALVSASGDFCEQNIKQALASFSGVARRFDFWVNTSRGVYMDDYAHHPQELRAMITSVRGMMPHRHLTVIFQPHLYTRTRDFAAEFIRSLSLADRVILLPIYPAREEPIEGVTSQMLLEGISCEKHLCEASELTTLLENLSTDVVVTAGAGNIDLLRDGVSQVIKNKLG